MEMGRLTSHCDMRCGKMESPRSHRRPVRCGAPEVEESELPESIKDLMEAFSEIRSDSLNTHDQVEYTIDLKERPATEVWAYI